MTPYIAELAKNTVAYYAATQPGRVCLIDDLNPCGGLRHWGGGAACPLCSARAVLALAPTPGLPPLQPSEDQDGMQFWSDLHSR